MIFIVSTRMIWLGFVSRSACCITLYLVLAGVCVGLVIAEHANEQIVNVVCCHLKLYCTSVINVAI